MEVLADENATPEQKDEADLILQEIYERKRTEMESLLNETLKGTGVRCSVIVDASGSWDRGGEYSFSVKIEATTNDEYLDGLDAITCLSEELKQDAVIEGYELSTKEVSNDDLINGADGASTAPCIFIEFDHKLSNEEKAKLIKAYGDDLTIKGNQVQFVFPSFMYEQEKGESNEEFEQRIQNGYYKWFDKIDKLYGNIQRVYRADLGGEVSRRKSYWRSIFHCANSREDANGNTIYTDEQGHDLADQTKRVYSNDRDNNVSKRRTGATDESVLRPSEQTAKLSEMFVKLSLGVTITEDAITTSNFDNSVIKDLSNEDFFEISEHLIGGFLYGNAETALRNIQASIKGNEFTSLSEEGQRDKGNWWDSLKPNLKEGYNKSNYNEGRRTDDRPNDRNYSEFYNSAEENSQDDVHIQGTSVTANDLRNALMETFAALKTVRVLLRVSRWNSYPTYFALSSKKCVLFGLPTKWQNSSKTIVSYLPMFSKWQMNN